MNSPLNVFLSVEKCVSLEANHTQDALHQSNEEERERERKRERENNFHSEGVYPLKHIITDAKSPALDI